MAVEVMDFVWWEGFKLGFHWYPYQWYQNDVRVVKCNSSQANESMDVLIMAVKLYV